MGGASFAWLSPVIYVSVCQQSIISQQCESTKCPSVQHHQLRNTNSLLLFNKTKIKWSKIHNPKKKIKTLYAMSNVFVSWVRRLANMRAHSLAKWSLSCNYFWFF
ncbi:hypothetical protein ACB094_12G104000 [Castanea mollissima]